MRIRIHRIHMFFGPLDSDPDSLVRGTDPDPDPSITVPSKNSKKNLDSYCFVTSFLLFIFENDVNVPSKSNKQKSFLKKLVFCWHLKVAKIAGSGSES